MADPERGLDPAVRRSDYRRTYILSDIALLVVSTWAIAASILFAALPSVIEQTFIGQAIPGHAEEAWNAVLLGGGALTAYGIVRVNLRIQATGLVLFATAFALNAYAIFDARDLAAGSLSGSFYFAFAAALLAQAVVLMRMARRNGALS